MTGTFINYGRQSIDDADIDAVVDALKSDFLTQGPAVEKFEAELARTVGARHAVAVSNGTAALHLACLAAGLDERHKAYVPALTFVATANAPTYCGAKVALLDIDPVSAALSPEAAADAGGGDRAAFLSVFFAGLAVKAKDLRAAAQEATIIADACHALGGRHEDGSPVGGCAHYDMAAFSFHPVKSITTGEGGAVTTNDDRLAEKLRLLRSHGIERAPTKFTRNHSEQAAPWYYEQQILGFNYRLTDIQAALGISQLRRLDQMIARRREIAAYYDDRFTGLDCVDILHGSKEERARSALHLYVLLIDFEKAGKPRPDFMAALREKQIGTQVHYIPLHRQPFHNAGGDLVPESFPHAERYYNRALSIPLFPSMTDSQAEYVADQICALLK